MVKVTPEGQYSFGAWQGHSGEPPADAMHPAESLVSAQHSASQFIRDQDHWCSDRCSFWIADPPID